MDFPRILKRNYITYPEVLSVIDASKHPLLILLLLVVFSLFVFPGPAIVEAQSPAITEVHFAAHELLVKRGNPPGHSFSPGDGRDISPEAARQIFC